MTMNCGYSIGFVVWSRDDAGRIVVQRSFALREGETVMAAPVTLAVGQTDNMSISYTDTDGNPMLVPPIPDFPPTWTQLNSAVATLTVSADGLTASELRNAVGDDTVSMVFTFGGVPFAASVAFPSATTTQTLGSVDIISNVV